MKRLDRSELSVAIAAADERMAAAEGMWTYAVRLLAKRLCSGTPSPYEPTAFLREWSAANGGWVGKPNAPASVAASGVWDIEEIALAKSGTGWPNLTYDVEYLLWGSGGSGSNGILNSNYGAGGGGGKVLPGTAPIVVDTVLTIVVGAAAPGPTTADSNGNNGNPSSFSGALSLSAAGGLRGLANGIGGASGSGSTGGTRGVLAAGGGGGETGNGVNGSGSTGGAAGAGYTSSITGTSLGYGGGGGGGAPSAVGTGKDGGSNGSGSSSSDAARGGGSGGSAGVPSKPGASGAGGAILRILTTKYSGITTGSPTVTTDGPYTVLQFNASGSYTA